MIHNFAKKEFYSVVAGGTILALNAGFINSVALNGVFEVAVSHLTGTLTRTSEDLIDWQFKLLGQDLGILLAFFFGCLINGLIVGDSKFKIGRSYGVILLLESVSLFFVVVIIGEWKIFAEFVTAFACGLQNSLATSYSGAVLRTTHMTGVITDLGILVGHLLRSLIFPQYVFTEYWKFKVLGGLLFGYFLGGILGYLSFKAISFYALLGPAILTGMVAVIYLTSNFVKKAKEVISLMDRKRSAFFKEEEVEIAIPKVTIHKSASDNVHANAESLLVIDNYHDELQKTLHA